MKLPVGITLHDANLREALHGALIFGAAHIGHARAVLSGQETVGQREDRQQGRDRCRIGQLRRVDRADAPILNGGDRVEGQRASALDWLHAQRSPPARSGREITQLSDHFAARGVVGAALSRRIGDIRDPLIERETHDGIGGGDGAGIGKIMDSTG